MAGKRFEDVPVWQHSRVLVKKVYAVSRGTLLRKEFGLRDQIERSAGGLLSDAFRVAQLFVMGIVEGPGLLRVILDASLSGLKYPGRENFLHTPARFRLAFRELGLSIGLHALKRLDTLIVANRDAFRDDRDIAVFLKTHWKYMSIGERIEACWLDGQHQASPAWKEHRDINMVMLATSLAPDGFLTLR